MKVKEKMMETKKKVSDWVKRNKLEICEAALVGVGIVIGAIGTYVFVGEDHATGRQIRKLLGVSTGDFMDYVSIPLDPDPEYGVKNNCVCIMSISDVATYLEKTMAEE